MQFSAERRGDIVILRPRGRIDHQNAESFSAALAPFLNDCRAGGDRLLFDLEGLEYISSAGLRVLMIATKRTRPAGGEIAMAAPQDVVREVLEITRFNQVFPVHASLDAGLAAFAPAADAES
jgi:anti-anti-sigma factor